VYSHRNIWHNAQGQLTNSTSLGIPLSSCAYSSYNVQLARYSPVSLQCPVAAHNTGMLLWSLHTIFVNELDLIPAEVSLSFVSSCVPASHWWAVQSQTNIQLLWRQLQVRDWNSLPADLRQTDIIFQRFKWLLKNFLFGCWDRGVLWLTVTGVPRKFSYFLTQRFGWCCRRSCERELRSGVQRRRWERQSTVEPCRQRRHSADRGIGYRC